MNLQSLLQINRIHPVIMNRTVARHLDLSIPKGQLFGVEVEVEGEGCHNIAYGIDAQIWRAVRDDSLRGESIELISPGPTPLSSLENACQVMSHAFQDWDTSGMSERTSLHVHYNVGSRTLRDLHKMLTGFYLLENLITRVAGGREREGNKFCLRACDSEPPIKAVVAAFQTLNFHAALKRLGRYANLNLLALFKFGTLETRCHKGTVDGNEILTWCLVLAEVFDSSADHFAHAADIMVELSSLGPADFLCTYYPRTAEYVATEVSDVEELVYEGLDHAQEIAYAIEEGEDGLKKPLAPALVKKRLQSAIPRVGSSERLQRDIESLSLETRGARW